MTTTVISENSFASCELVQAFGDRIYSIAKHITQNDDASEDVLIETFLEACTDWDGCPEDENVWLRLVTIAVREAFSNLNSRGEGRLLLDRLPDSYDDQPRHSRERTARVLEHGLRSLDQMARTVFVLRDIEQISVEHVARIVNHSVAAVKVCLLRARLRLGETLNRHMRLA